MIKFSRLFNLENFIISQIGILEKYENYFQICRYGKLWKTKNPFDNNIF